MLVYVHDIDESDTYENYNQSIEQKKREKKNQLHGIEIDIGEHTIFSIAID